MRMSKAMIEHKQVTILDPTSNEMIEVDEGLAPLLKEIWDFGIRTCNSCQENKPGTMWIEFLTSEDVEAFLTRIISSLDLANSSEADNCLYSRMVGENCGWQYNAHPHDFREYIDAEKGTIELNPSEPCGIALSISIRFPVGDYERLLDIVRR
jgi:hypothetical protein